MLTRPMGLVKKSMVHGKIPWPGEDVFFYKKWYAFLQVMTLRSPRNAVLCNVIEFSKPGGLCVYIYLYKKFPICP